jgi:DNA gyrase/topoisomerase IV subunit B
MATKRSNEYSSASVQTLRFPDDVRANVGVYLGSTDASGLWVAVREPLDNVADEYMAGRGTFAHLHIDEDGSYWIADDADGIPQGIKKHTAHINGEDIEVKTPTMQAIFGELHTSGKYHSEAYKVSRGTHGIGVKGTNATAEFFEVWTFYKGKWYSIAFVHGKIKSRVAECKAPKLWDGKVAKKGTIIHFKPDAKVFSAKSFPKSVAVEWAELAAYLTPGFTVTLSSKDGTRSFLSKQGPTEYVEKMMEKAKCEGERDMFQYKSELADVIVAFTNHDGFAVKGFTNGLSQSQGGKHVDSVSGAIYASLKPWIKTKKVTVDGKKKEVPAFKESDLKEGMMGLVNLYLHKATYSSQDKGKLTDDRAGAPFEAMLEVAATEFFKGNKALAQRLCDRATKMNELKTKFVMSKKAATRLNAIKRGGLPAKFASWNTQTKVADRELFLVEGDSAGGSAKEARFPYQAVLPLRGKMANALKNAAEKTLESEEILNILAAIGFDVNAADPYEKLSVGKIICLADPDPDGPFVADTKIRVRVAHQDHLEIEYPIEVLAQSNIQEFSVPVWTGTEEVWAPATAQLERNVSTIVALEIAGTKYKVSEDHKWLVHSNTKAMYGRESTESRWPDLVYVRSADLKIGDRVFLPSNNGSKKLAEADKWSKLGYAPVSKMRIQHLNEPVPVYCLTVPKHHSFILPSGIVSSNCHINSLLLTLFYKYLPELFERGMVYVANAPEFYAIHKEQLVIGDTLAIVQSKLKDISAPASTTVHHVKGYGELSASLMRILAMDPATRRLIKIQAIEDEDRVDFVRLMNDDVDFRKELLGLPKNAVAAEEEAPAKKKVVAKKTPPNMLDKNGVQVRGKRVAGKGPTWEDKPKAKSKTVNKKPTSKLKKAA